MNLKVKPDEHIDGTIVMAVDRSLLSSQSQDALVDELRKRVVMGTPSGSRKESYSDAPMLFAGVLALCGLGAPALAIGVLRTGGPSTGSTNTIATPGLYTRDNRR